MGPPSFRVDVDHLRRGQFHVDQVVVRVLDARPCSHVVCLQAAWREPFREDSAGEDGVAGSVVWSGVRPLLQKVQGRVRPAAKRVIGRTVAER